MSKVSTPESGGRSPSPPQRRRLSTSPPSRRRRQRRGEVVVERVVEKSSGSIQWPILTRTNYQEWSLLMRVNMEAQGYWHAVEPDDDEIEYREDRLALAAILRSVPTDMLGSLARKRTARSAWEAVKTVRVSVERVREANATS